MCNIFGFAVPLVSLILFGSAVVLIIFVVFLYMRPLWRVRNAVRCQEEETDDAVGAVPVSVVVYADDDSAEALRFSLPDILSQCHAAPFEVIVVNDGRSDAVTEVVERLRRIHDNLYMTYTPESAQQLSRKKLALTIGIKAARYPVIMNTMAYAKIEGNRWLARMTEPFSKKGTEIVLGYSFIDTDADRRSGKRWRSFNSAADAVAWLGAALGGHPYRGTEMNLAYTSDVFFRNKGFSKSLNLKYGDDDIFVKEVARRHNTAVVLHPDTMVGRRVGNVPRAYRFNREKHYFTGKYVPQGARRIQALGGWLLWMVTGLCVAAAIAGLPSVICTCIASFILLGMWIPAVILWRKAIMALNGRKMLFILPLLMFTRPFANIATRIRAFRNRRSNYTWS